VTRAGPLQFDRNGSYPWPPDLPSLDEARFQGSSIMQFSSIIIAVSLLLAGAFGQENAPQTPIQPPASTVSSPAAQGTPADSAPAQAGSSAQSQAAQEPSSDDAGTFVFKKQVEEVVLHATVFDGQRNPVPGLDKSAFTVLENGVPQPITSFRRQDVPVAIGIVVDNSGSMRDKRDEVNQAVLNLIRVSNPEDEIFVVNFGQKYYLDQDYTADVHLLESALHQVSAAGNTALYDAIVASAVHLKNNPRLEKRVLLVITDGKDNMSQETLQEAARRLQQTDGPTLYAIGLTGGDLNGTGREALQELAQVTGGVAYFPDSLGQVGDITRTIAHDIRSQYIIAYHRRSQNAKPGEQSVKVEAQSPGFTNLTVSTRSGHYYPGGTPR
jgi:Ca-activated chloride channel homolog